MKSSALASYLESVANAIRASKSSEVPHIKWTAFKGPAILHVGSFAPLTIPAHSDCPDLACIFPGLKAVTAEAHGSTVSLRNDLADMSATASNLRKMADRFAVERDDMRKLCQDTSLERNQARVQLAEAQKELEALRQTVARMRSSGSTVAPVVPSRPVAPVVAPQVDLINAILSDYSPMEAGPAFEVVKPPTHVARQEAVYQSPDVRPVMVLCFPLNCQGKTLAKAAVALDEVKALFTFKFINPKDATAGGYWLARDATGPKAQELARTLAKEGATVGSSLPEHANR